jgi:hypothetical protein
LVVALDKFNRLLCCNPAHPLAALREHSQGPSMDAASTGIPPPESELANRLENPLVGIVDT